MSRTYRHRRNLECTAHARDRVLQTFGWRVYTKLLIDSWYCSDCDRAGKKWGYYPDGWRIPKKSPGMRLEARNERRARRHTERIELRKGNEPIQRTQRKWLD